LSLAEALEIPIDTLKSKESKEDKNILTALNLSQFSFFAFPILAVVIPMIIWVLQKEKSKEVDRVGKSILNFQMSWMLLFFLSAGVLFFLTIVLRSNFFAPWIFTIAVLLVTYNVIIIVVNSVFSIKGMGHFYKPAIKFLN
jgi:uncharacterized Tic20 family protein